MEAGGYGRLIASLTGPQDLGTPPAGRAPGAAADAAPVTPAPSPQGEQPGVQPPASQSGESPAAVVGDRPSGSSTGIVPESRGPRNASEDPAAHGELALVSANPPQLQISDPEVAALGRMGPLIGTPRAATRLVNLYRLIRAGMPDEDIESFVANGQFRPLAIVLATQVGFPRVASPLLRTLVAEQGDSHLTDCLDRIEEAGDVDSAGWGSLTTALRAVCVENGRPVADFNPPASELREWIPRLRRYSFEGALSQS
jgi:hypothetical protein